MGTLKLALGLYLVFFCVSALADSIPVLDGVEVSTQGSLGTERTDFYGFSGDLAFGSIFDSKNKVGDFHLSYTDYLEPSDPTTDSSPLKSVTFWSGGFGIIPFESASAGVDFDSNDDSFEGLYTAGLRLSIGYGVMGASYRNARITLQTPSAVYVDPINGSKVKYIGAFIYQQSVDLSARLRPRKSTTVFISASYAWYDPNASELTNLLTQGSLASLTNLQSALDNFQLWSVSIGWREKLSDHWDIHLAQTYSNLIIAANPYLVSNASFGYKWSDSLYSGLGYQYMYTPLSDTSSIILELRVNWDKDDADLPSL